MVNKMVLKCNIGYLMVLGRNLAVMSTATVYCWWEDKMVGRGSTSGLYRVILNSQFCKKHNKVLSQQYAGYLCGYGLAKSHGSSSKVS